MRPPSCRARSASLGEPEESAAPAPLACAKQSTAPRLAIRDTSGTASRSDRPEISATPTNARSVPVIAARCRRSWRWATASSNVASGTARGSSVRGRRGCGRARSRRRRTRPRTTARRGPAFRRARPRGGADRIAAITAASSRAARPKRRPAPQSGSSSRLLYRTPTALPPASTASARKAASATRSARSASVKRKRLERPTSCHEPKPPPGRITVDVDSSANGGALRCASFQRGCMRRSTTSSAPA